MRGRCLSVAGTGAGSNRLERFGGVAAFVAVIGRHISTSIGRFSGATGGSFGPPVSSVFNRRVRKKPSITVGALWGPRASGEDDAPTAPTHSHHGHSTSFRAS